MPPVSFYIEGTREINIAAGQKKSFYDRDGTNLIITAEGYENGGVVTFSNGDDVGGTIEVKVRVPAGATRHVGSHGIPKTTITGS